MHTGVGHEAQLICVVHAEPQAHVIWYKETTQIGTTEQLSQQVRTRIFHIKHKNCGNRENKSQRTARAKFDEQL